MCAQVKLHLLNVFRLELKMQYIDMEVKTVGDAIKRFEQQYLAKLPEYLKTKDQKHLTDQILILLNGANVKNLDGMKTLLTENDEIQLSVPIIGG
jgi:molybdopterin converting factor small subunit